MPESYSDATTKTIGNWVSWTVTRMVGDWVNTPGSNLGMKISQDSTNTTAPPEWYWYKRALYRFNSRNSTTVDLRPILAVRYTRPSGLSAQHWELYH